MENWFKIINFVETFHTKKTENDWRNVKKLLLSDPAIKELDSKIKQKQIFFFTLQKIAKPENP